MTFASLACSSAIAAMNLGTPVKHTHVYAIYISMMAGFTLPALAAPLDLEGTTPLLLLFTVICKFLASPDSVSVLGYLPVR